MMVRTRIPDFWRPGDHRARARVPGQHLDADRGDADPDDQGFLTGIPAARLPRASCGCSGWATRASTMPSTRVSWSWARRPPPAWPGPWRGSVQDPERHV